MSFKFGIDIEPIKANTNWIGIGKKEIEKKVYPLGKSTPWNWCLEISHGCNLKCGHCCAELIKEENKQLISMKTWEDSLNIINQVSPTVRIELTGIVGEPTLHPELLELIKIARQLAPRTQIQLLTNGINLKNGKYKCKDLLDAGLNVIYIDQYGTHEEFEKLAEESGYPWYQYYNAPKDAPSPWTYYGSKLKLIALQEEPSNWPNSRKISYSLGNWYNNLNWEKAKKFGMKPLEKSLNRRCKLPYVNISVTANGDYLECCQDGMHITAGKFGNVSDGIEGFKKYWFGKDMQIIRKHLRDKNREAIKDTCAICNATFPRGDYIYWKHDDFTKYWNGNTWQVI